MVASVRIGLVLALVTASASASLQLAPREAEEDCDGVKLHYLVFSDGENRVSYAPPRGWHYSGGGDRFTMQPAKANAAEATIRVFAAPQSQALDEPALKRLTESAIASLPSSAAHVSVISAEKNPVVINHKETFLVILQYDCYGAQFSRSVMFLNRPNEQLQFQLTSPRMDFARLQKEFLTSHFSWQNL